MQSTSAPTRLAETRRRVRVPYAVLAVSLLSTAAAALYVGAEASENDRAHFQSLADRTQGSIARRIDSYITVLRGTSGLFAASDKILAAEFRAYVSRLAIEERYPGVQGVGASLRIAAQHKAPTVASIRQQPGLEDFDIKPADPRPEYHAILYLEPLDARNRRAIGYDMFTEPTRRAAMERARDRAEPALSAKTTLLQEGDVGEPQPGFLIYLPIYQGGRIPSDVDERRERLLGFVYSPFRADDLFGSIFHGGSMAGIAFEIYDGTDVNPAALLYRSSGTTDADDGHAAARFRKRALMSVAGHPWTLILYTTPAFNSSSSRGLTLVVIGLGAMVSVLLFRISYGQSTARLHAERSADELRESEQALRASESRFRRLADSNLVGVAFVDMAGQVNDANAALLAILGRTHDEVVRGAVRWDEITPPEYRDADARAIEQLRATGVCAPYEKQYMRADGSRVAVLVGIAMLEGDTGEAVGIVMDLTERNRSVEALKAARDAADAARANAEGANRLKDEFLATISHELRTPLNAILGWSQILREGASDPDELAQGLSTIERNAKAQAQLVEDLLDVSRIVSGKLRLVVKAVAMPSVIGAAIEAVHPAADAKGVIVQQVFDPGTGPVSGDPDRLQQVVWNLLSNAVKFTPRGGTVRVSLRANDGNAEVAVSDTGRGISADFLPYVFERFRQADSSITRQFGGLGLGLGIVRHLVELHGGTVAAMSPGEGHGATFVVTLPLATAPAHGSSAPDAGDRPAVVDCPPLTLLAKILRDCGAAVMMASSAAEAFEKFIRATPDILVSDIGMPDEDGYSLLKRIRAAEIGDARVPAIALTALARAEDRRRSLMAGYQMHLAKPVEPAELRSAIAGFVGRSPVGT